MTSQRSEPLGFPENLVAKSKLAFGSSFGGILLVGQPAQKEVFVDDVDGSEHELINAPISEYIDPITYEQESDTIDTNLRWRPGPFDLDKTLNYVKDCRSDESINYDRVYVDGNKRLDLEKRIAIIEDLTIHSGSTLVFTGGRMKRNGDPEDDALIIVVRRLLLRTPVDGATILVEYDPDERVRHPPQPRARDGRHGASAGADGQDGSDGKSGNNARRGGRAFMRHIVLIFDEIEVTQASDPDAQFPPLRVITKTPRADRGGRGGHGGNGGNGAVGENCSTGWDGIPPTFQCLQGAGKGGNAGSGGRGGRGGHGEHAIQGPNVVQASTDRALEVMRGFGFVMNAGKPGKSGRPGRGGERGERGREGPSRFPCIPSHRHGGAGRRGRDGRKGRPGKDAEDGRIIVAPISDTQFRAIWE